MILHLTDHQQQIEERMAKKKRLLFVKGFFVVKVEFPLDFAVKNTGQTE